MIPGIFRHQFIKACKKLDAIEFASYKKDEASVKKIKKSLEEAQIYRATLKPKSRIISNKLVQHLDLRITSLFYRIHGIDTFNQTQYESLCAKALAWKQKQLKYNPSSQLTESDLEHLKTLSSYPAFVKLIENRSEDLAHFFKWSILNNLSAKVYVEFIATAGELDRSYLKPRIGSFGGKDLQYIDTDRIKKVALVFEGQTKSIIKNNKIITLSNDLKMSVKEIFKTFQTKNLNEGHLTYFDKEGICNWDPHEFGPFNPATGKVDRIDLSHPDWYKSLRIKEHFKDAKEASDRFGVKCDGKNFVLSVVAARQTKKFTTFGAHSFIRFAYPLEDGSYACTYGWGKFAKEYPQSDFEALAMLFAPCQGTLEYPDNNESYTHRQMYEKHFLLSPEKGKELIDSLRNDILKVRDNNFAFQILVKNCTDWIVKKIHKFVGEEESKLFDIKFLELEPNGPLGVIVKVMRKSPEWFRLIFFFCFSFTMGGWKSLKIRKKNGEIKKICLLKTPPWGEKSQFHHPAKLLCKELD